MRPIKRFCLLLFLPGVLFANEKDLEIWLAELSSVEGKFVQQVYDPEHRILQHSSGHFSIQRPGKFRWHYQKPYEQLVVSNGRELFIYDKDLEQVTVKDLGEEKVALPALLLSHDGQLADSFEIQPLQDEGRIIRFLLLPRQAGSPFTRIELGFADGKLRKMVLSDHLEQSTEIEFQDAIRNPNLPAEYFEFKIPDGVDVIEQF